MHKEKEQQEKTKLHARNRNRAPYNLEALIAVQPDLSPYIKPNKYRTTSIDFSNPVAVKLLNKALLDHYYGIEYWDFPDRNLCPPIPGRVDYLHYIADLLSKEYEGQIPRGDQITCLDIGLGASCIYPILGVVEYDWRFIGSDIDKDSLESARKIVQKNAVLQDKIECRLQKNEQHIFRDILNDGDKIDVSICNPPFHASKAEAQKANRRKVRNLTGKHTKTSSLNFAGVNKELIYAGGELRFIKNMIKESKQYSKHCRWFSTLVSKQSNLKEIYRALKKVDASDIETILVGTGNKNSRIVAWCFG